MGRTVGNTCYHRYHGERTQVSAAEVLMPGATLRITDATSSKVNLCDDASKLWSLYGTMLAAKE